MPWRAEAIHSQILRRIKTLDEQYAFVRTHIFWVRDAEPLGVATIAHARDESIRAAKAVVKLGLETGDGSLWNRPSPEFVAAVLLLAIIPGRSTSAWSGSTLPAGRDTDDRARTDGGEHRWLTPF